MCTNVIRDRRTVKGANEPYRFPGTCTHIRAHCWLWHTQRS